MDIVVGMEPVNLLFPRSSFCRRLPAGNSSVGIEPFSPFPEHEGEVSTAESMGHSTGVRTLQLQQEEIGKRDDFDGKLSCQLIVR